MSGAFISPRISEILEFEGIKFKVRGLTAEEKMPILFRGHDGTDSVNFGPEAFKIAVHTGLVGWDVRAPKWSKKNLASNIARLSDAAYLAIGQKILDLTFVDAEAEENLQSPSTSPQLDDDSIAAEK